MPKIIVNHRVTDVAAWKAADGAREKIMANFASDIVSFTDPKGSDTVGLTMNVHDMDEMQRFIKSPEAAASMAKHGVLPETMIILTA